MRFRAEALGGIDAVNCPVDCWVIPMSYQPTPQSTVTVLYAFYLMLREGVNRVRALQAPQGLILDGYRRSFRWWDGKPCWTPVNGGAKTWDHPRGYVRQYDGQSRRWFWRKLSIGPATWDTKR